MTCSACAQTTDDLKRVPGCGRALYCPSCRKAIAVRNGLTNMSCLSPEQRAKLGELGGNTLLRRLGVQYYSSLGKRSAQVKAEKRREAYAAGQGS
jgi:hypothetical protein